jgi:dynein heavy chain
LLDWDAAKYEYEIDEISGTASGEAQIENQLRDVRERWAVLAFEIIPYRDFKDKFLISGVDDFITILEDDQMAVGTMMGSKFVAEIREDVERMEQSLKYIDIVLVEWLTFQRNWMYLENIFSADDIRE